MALLAPLGAPVTAVDAQVLDTAAGDWRGGVFDRRSVPPSKSLGQPVTPIIKQNPAWKLLPVADKEGFTNDVVIILNVRSPALLNGLARADAVGANGPRFAVEVGLVKALDDFEKKNAQSAFNGIFGQPIAARLLIQGDRVSNEKRIDGSTDDSLELLQRYVVLRYETPELARDAAAHLLKSDLAERATRDFVMTFSSTPTDFYFSPPAGQLDSNYQWGMFAMNFSGSGGAWARTRGGGYVGAADALTWDDAPGLFGHNPANFSSNNTDSNPNFRKQLSFRTGLSGSEIAAPHGRHVVGIIAAQASNSALGGGSSGVAGGCPNCSLGLGATASVIAAANSAMALAAAVTGLVQRGVSTINISMNAGIANASCAYSAPVCDALNFAVSRDVLVVNSSGNYNEGAPRFPANVSTVLPVGAIQLVANSGDASSASNWQRMSFITGTGALFAGNAVPFTGVSSPGRNIISTFKPGDDYNAEVLCGDATASDGTTAPRRVIGDGFGTCSGTSMAAPHVTALVGLMRSTRPLMTYSDISYYVQQSGHLAASPGGELGYGVPNAKTALDFLTSPYSGSSRLTPLFSMFSDNRQDYFYTTSPQMGAAAWWGTLEPRANTTFPDNYATNYGTYASVGTAVPYASFPGTPWYQPTGAQAWVFTTPENPLSGIPLVPLFRLSFACNHPAYAVAQPAVCSSYPEHTDSTYTTDAAGVAAFQSVGYLLDGIEGYIYPKTLAQPSGTVRLLRKYNATRDDHAIFPENLLTQYTNEGYTLNSGSDWLGYVYPNYGSVPTVQ